MGLFNRNDPMMGAMPIVDVTPQQPMPEQPQTMDPMMAAQLTRMYEADAGAVGVAQITVDNKKLVEEFKARMRGYIIRRKFNMDTGQEEGNELVKFGEPVMNEEGINHVCGLLESFLSKNIMLSNIPLKDHKQILIFCRVFYRTIAAQIAFNSELWRVDRSRRDTIPSELSTMLYTNFMRAYDDGERRKLYPGQKNITTTMINPAQLQPERRSLINF